ncbi:DUF2935 domain-containing protein [Sinanaerobacter chloroacetimidivorans]|uniref:DUF2935 domain-containing protein n=1 Tax=Sinanaerobacter chloroacetimidivorans TaxID=2818044 RepID=A0A8J7W318_9FIRM|nr:DUF2935 domain-containing protein [Sinanaerobacter chloroacetimidivorans]MBR0599969.1 DUF2935 domain-containing protein [Sinanaerobacter chloroacetimidivorans]
MDGSSLHDTALFEHRFWLQIMGDHAFFIYNALSPGELSRIEKANYFFEGFQALLEEARKPLSEIETQNLTRDALKHTLDFRAYQLELLRDELVGEIVLGISPTFMNHMLNESEEYIRIMNSLLNNEIPVATPLHLHKLWLPDASGHAEIIESGLDGVERSLKETSADFEEKFNGLAYKTDQFIGYTRTGVFEFPALNRLNEEADSTMLSFMEFIQRVALLKISKRALGTLMPLIADHMFREECYYLTQLSKVSQVARPNCDPARPRI